jgi:hypothetical protein
MTGINNSNNFLQYIKIVDKKNSCGPSGLYDHLSSVHDAQVLTCHEGKQQRQVELYPHWTPALQ